MFWDLDWRIPLDVSPPDPWAPHMAVQGNLDPITLFAPPEVIEVPRPRNSGPQLTGRPGHIFNLGHGIVPGTPVDNVINVVKRVKQYSAEVASKHR